MAWKDILKAGNFEQYMIETLQEYNRGKSPEQVLTIRAFTDFKLGNISLQDFKNLVLSALNNEGVKQFFPLLKAPITIGSTKRAEVPLSNINSLLDEKEVHLMGSQTPKAQYHTEQYVATFKKTGGVNNSPILGIKRRYEDSESMGGISFLIGTGEV